MAPSQGLTRRALLRASPAIAAVGATSAFAAPYAVAAGPSVALLNALAEYEAASIENVAAEQARIQMGRNFAAELVKARLRVRASPWGKDFIALGDWTWPHHAEQAIEKSFADRARVIAANGRASSRSERLAENEAIRRQMLQEAQPVFDEFERIKERIGWTAAHDREDDASSRRAAAIDALKGFNIESIEEVRAVATAYYRTALATERWYEIPTHNFLLALVPELAVAGGRA